MDTKRERCRFCFPSLQGVATVEYQCRKQNYSVVTGDDCDKCSMYKSRFIEYPINVTKIDQHPIDYGDCLYKQYVGKPVKVRVGDKTHLGLFLGELPTSMHISHNDTTEVLTATPIMNPAMFVPELNRIVFGYESWWSIINSADDFKDITDEDINAVWYVQMAKEMFPKEKED